MVGIAVKRIPSVGSLLHVASSLLVLVSMLGFKAATLLTEARLQLRWGRDVGGVLFLSCTEQFELQFMKCFCCGAHKARVCLRTGRRE